MYLDGFARAGSWPELSPSRYALVCAVAKSRRSIQYGPICGRFTRARTGSTDSACVFRRIWALVPAVMWALIPEDLGTQSERSDGVRSGSERSDEVRVRWLVESGW
jgi:hypothetical protein